jgi:hypothetical protein
MDDIRIDVCTDHGVSYTCAERERERESAVALRMFIVMLFYITSTHKASLKFRPE